MPIGYVDRLELSMLEKNVAAGRLRPRAGTEVNDHWNSYTVFQKNCWLWAETYRIILEGVEDWPEERVKFFRFENLFTDPEMIQSLLDFLGLEDIEYPDIKRILSQKMNARKKRAIPTPEKWDRELIRQFDEIAGSIMKKLGYYQ